MKQRLKILRVHLQFLHAIFNACFNKDSSYIDFAFIIHIS